MLKVWATSEILEKLPKVNNHPTGQNFEKAAHSQQSPNGPKFAQSGKNSPNPVTLFTWSRFRKSAVHGRARGRYLHSDSTWGNKNMIARQKLWL
jgi:hypothetical protein